MKEAGKSIIFYLFSFIFFILLAFPCFAENEFSLRITPVVEVPVGLSQFSAGIGAVASLDWVFWPVTGNFYLGIAAEGEFVSLPMQVGDPLALLEGMAGPLVHWRPFDRWAFRTGVNGGVYRYSRAGESEINLAASFSLGGEFFLSPYFSLFADGAYTYRFFSSQPLHTIGAALGLRLNLSEIMGGRARVQTEKTQQYPVFPVSWAWYENNPLAAVKVTNKEPNTITDVTLSFYMDNYMSQPWFFAAVPRLAPGESAEVPVTALFNEAVINLSRTVTANGVLNIQYRSLGLRKESAETMQMPIFHRNNLSWDDDRRAAAFVSARDSSVRHFARYSAGAIKAKLRQSNTPSSVLYAAALFESLRLYGIKYIIDPSSSYIMLSEDAAAVDSLNYPYETLYYRGGDCDDLSILFCSMLEALDIESAFITIPGHIYIAFNIDDEKWNANNSDIFTINGKRWLPVEITVPGRGFAQAWRTGAQQWKNAGGEASLYSIRDCWKIYPSVTVPGSGDNLPEMPEWEDIIRAVSNEQSRMRN